MYNLCAYLANRLRDETSPASCTGSDRRTEQHCARIAHNSTW